MSFNCTVRCSGSVQVVSQRLPFAKAVFTPTAIHMQFMVDKMTLGQASVLPSTSVWSCLCCSANGPYSLIYLSPVLCNIGD